jgi:hypothetical protein
MVSLAKNTKVTVISCGMSDRAEAPADSRDACGG